ncbi:YitT family protein [Kribbella sp. NPDC059898]|uniref:membrane protein YczE n=1 Tax=Kribbella sp. NPDC059898 TaxID=3346995 RepID=UPI00365EF28E
MNYLERRTGRIAQLLAGLAVLALGEVMIIKAHLGVIPWDVLAQGMLHQFGLTIGQWSMIIGGVVLLLWIPMRERPGLGTVTNVALTGFGLDFFTRILPAPHGPVAAGIFLVAGVILNGIGTAAYIGSRMGSGPRDGLMTGLVRLTGGSVRLVRTCLEIAVVTAGAILGGNLGVGTIVFALSIGMIVHLTLPYFARAKAVVPQAEPCPEAA